MMGLEEINAAAWRAMELGRLETPEQRRLKQAERNAIRHQVLEDIDRGEQAIREALAGQHYKG